MKRLGFDWYRFTGCQGRELRCDFGLNQAPMWISEFKFPSFFPQLFWPFLQSFVRVLVLCGLCAYNGMSLGQNLDQYPCALKMEYLILITITKLPYLHQI